MSKRKVLIPLDGSKTSRQILAVVQHFLNPGDVQLTLLRITQPFIDPASGTYMSSLAMPRPPISASNMSGNTSNRQSADAEAQWRSYQQAARDELEAEATPLRQAGYSVDIAVRAGNPVDEIVRFVQDEQMDLIAMATHGRKGLNKLLMGSVTEEVLRSAPVPILLERSVASNGFKPPLYG